jgi:hypothetical protein
VWIYPGDAAWHFVTLERTLADKVREWEKGKPRRGWGAVRVAAKLGKSAWETSIFPVKQDGTYILPIKASVRKAEGVLAGDVFSIALTIGEGTVQKSH